MNHLSRPRRIGVVVLFLATVAAGAVLWRSVQHTPKPGPAETPSVKELPGPGAAAQAIREPAVWAVVVGIDAYRDGRIPPCHGASGDARAVARWLGETAGWGSSHVLVLDDAGVPDMATFERTAAESLLPTRENLAKAATGWLVSKPIRPGDVVVLYFAGQAAIAPAPAGAPADAPGSAVLLPIDARASAVAESGWSPDDLIAAVTAAGAGVEQPVRVVCWLDTSLSGRGESWSATSKSRPEAAAVAWLSGLARWPGASAWLAAVGVPSVEAARSDQRSPFTAALLRGLGTPARPGNLLTCLDRMRHEPKLTAQGFRTVGGVAPDFGLWPSWVRRVVDTPPELLLQRGHAGPVQSLAVSPDGASLFTAGADSTVRLWRLADRKLTGVLPSHLIGVTALALRQDARLLASGDGNGLVHFWDLTRRVEVRTLPGQSAGIETLAFLPDGNHLASLDLDGRTLLWSIRENELGFFEIPQPVEVAKAASGLAASAGTGLLGFVQAEGGKTVKLFDTGGKLVETLQAPGGIVTSPRLATYGSWIVAGDSAGKVMAWDLAAASHAAPRLIPTTSKGPIDRVAVGPGGRLALTQGQSLQVMVLDAKGSAPSPIDLKDKATRLAFSPDGRWLAAVVAHGPPRVWNIDPPGADPQELKLVAPRESTTESLAFLPDGRGLVAGDRAGGYSGWVLPGGGPLFGAVRGRTGRVAALSVSRDRRYLLQVSREGDALVWDLARGRTLTRLDGRWVGGALTPDGTQALLTSSRGEVALVDRATGRPLPVAFERPKDAGPGCRFGPVAVDAGGRLVAAGSVQHGPIGPVACVWEVATGKLVKILTGHAEPHALTAVELAPDGRRLLTASEDGTARVWDLGPDQPAGTAKPVAVFRVAAKDDDPPVAVLAARFDPSDPRFVITGSIDGRVLAWAVGRDRPVTTVATIDRAVNAVAVTPDGRWLAASGVDKFIRLWDLSRARDPKRPDDPPTLTAGPLRLQASTHHDEQVNALLAWPTAEKGEGAVPPILASGSDDTTVRLWRLSDRTLLGTLAADLVASGAGGAPRATWVVYTPDGLFDSAIDGERQVTWLRRGELLPLEQYYDVAHQFALADRLRLGDRPPAPSFPPDPAPRVALDRPVQVVADRPESALTIHVGPPGAENLRLYHNGVPILGDSEVGIAPSGGRATVSVKLTRGVNRFYAMASRPGAIDGRSNEVELLFDRAEEPARRVHILALGVGCYAPEARALRFADGDAKSIAEFLHRNAPARGALGGARVTLTDSDVNEQKVVESFLQIRDSDLAPDDTVVVFLAGHTGTQRERYYLLLPDYPFPAGTDMAGDLREVRSRTALPFSAVQENLARLRCLNRLVIVDACQAEAVLDDPTVQRLGRAVDDAAHRARTAYILAARRGESASEAPLLKHGLLTYTLLKGLGETGLESLPEATFLNDPPTADRDGDGVVTAAELSLYTDQTLPRLASSLPDLVQRTGVGLRVPADARQQHPRVQATDLNFPVLRLPGK